MSQVKIYTYKNFTGTLKEIIEHFNLDIKYGTLLNRLHKGMTLEEAIENPIDSSKAVKHYTYKGFTGSVKEIVDHFGLDINHNVLRIRLFRGMPIEQAIEKPVQNKRVKQFYTYKDFTGSIPEIIDHFGLDLSYSCIVNRINRGMTIEEAIKKPVNKTYQAKYFTYKGFTGTISDIIKHFNLDIERDVVNSRLHCGMSIERAIETPVSRGKKVYTYNGFTGTIPQIIKHFNLQVHNSTLYDRINKGMTIEEAIGNLYSK